VLNQQEITERISELTASGLDWPAAANGIDRDTPLGSEGIGLDSVLVIELAVLIEREFGITLLDEEIPALADKSLRQIADDVHERRAAEAARSGAQ
jgi:acyl carrier protein